MFAVQVTRVLRPVGVLLGGSGHVRPLLQRGPQLAALMRPYEAAMPASEGSVNHAFAGRVSSPC